MNDSNELSNLTRAVEAQIPFNRVLGLQLGDLDPSRTTLSFEMRDDLVGNFARGSLHGGVISATLDVAGGMSAITTAVGNDTSTMAERFAHLGTIDLRVDYLRPGVGARFEAVAYTLRAGNKVAVTRMELRNDSGDLIAVGTGTYLIG
ncbi:MAG: thioesterase family protein [Gammaproteobacteria bacterium]|nr:thioesterase family protein [Gammaproteobacteria bacterium]